MTPTADYRDGERSGRYVGFAYADVASTRSEPTPLSATFGRVKSRVDTVEEGDEKRGTS